MRPDLIVSKDGKPIICIEVKKLNYDLEKSDFRSGKVQLAEYLHALGDLQWGILTNGYEWRLYDFKAVSGGLDILKVDLRSDEDQIDLTKKGIEDICYDLLGLHECTYTSKGWFETSLEATAFSPESLAKAILSAEVIKVIARSIKGEHDYKANFESLVEKIHNLLVEGLNDEIKGWGETNQVELNKYVKSQKKSGRRKKRTKKTADDDSGGSMEVNINSPNAPLTTQLETSITDLHAVKKSA